MNPNMRTFTYAALDFLKGGDRARILHDVNRVTWDRDHAQSYTQHSLRRLLDHAVNTTEAYRHIERGAPLTTFPIINKNFIRENSDSLLSSGFRQNRLTLVSTSGSTGTPLVVKQDRHKRERRSAEAIYFGRLAGYDLGTRLYNLKIWSARNHQSRLTHIARNTRPIDVVTFSDFDISSLLAEIEATRQPVSIIAYASALDRLALYLEDRGQPVRGDVRAVIAQSEALASETRLALQEYLRASVVGRYGMEETGIIAQQEADSSDYVVNRAGAHVEILSFDSDMPATPSTLGRIVVTDLHNYAMPLIRYDTGDLGAFSFAGGKADLGRLASVEGRRLDQLFDVNDQHVSSFVFYKSIWKFPGIRQFQIVQTAKGVYTLRLNATQEFRDESALMSDLVKHLGTGASINVAYVDEIPLLSSGKRRQVVQEYRQ